MAAETDISLINELWEEIERNPPAIQARKILVEQFIAAEWMDAARDAVRELSVFCNDEEVQNWKNALARDDPTIPPPPYSTSGPSRTSRNTRSRPLNPAVTPASLPTETSELRKAKLELIQSYKAFRKSAHALLRNGQLLQNLRQKKGLPPKNDTQITVDDLEALASGKITTVLRSQLAPENQSNANSDHSRPPESARAVARKIAASPENALDIAITDLESMAKFLRSSGSQPSSIMDTDTLREILAKRVRTLTTALPKNLESYAHTAMTHIEHELLDRKYVNDETMLGDAISEIPRDHFYVTEDNYAWSMDELAQAITSNSGVMRNPLSKHMFTQNDIRGILQHPMGKSLAALGMEQKKLKQGVRPKTIEEMERMANVFMVDMAEDALKSRQAVDEFLAYLATLPEAEQKAIDNLSVPAKDSHTGQAFDGTIGEAVRDSKANKLCFHKAGDFIKQACTYLRKR